MTESLFENKVGMCADYFNNTLSIGEKNQLGADIFSKRKRILETLEQFEPDKGGAFIDEVSDLDRQISKIADGDSAVFLVNMFRKNEFKVPARWADREEVMRTILRLACESDLNCVKREQVILRDHIKPSEKSTLYRINKVNRLSLFNNSLSKLKTPPLGERPGQMQV